MSPKARPGWLITILWVRDALAFHRRRPRARHYIAAATVAAALAGVGGGSLVTQPVYNADGGGHEASIGAPLTSHRCGVERWDVKTGTDTLASSVHLTPQASTVAALAALPAPSSWPPPSRLRAESTTYEVTATLQDYKLEADGDYHLVLGADGSTIIGEIPDPGCVGASSPFRSAITQTRAAFDQQFHAGPTLQPANASIKVTGVLFFDKIHGQAGVAPNGVELHPILSLTFAGG